MRRYLAAAGLPLFLLAACGSGGEDFAVDVEASPAKVFAPLTRIDFEMARRALQGIEIRQSQPGEGEVLFTIPSLTMAGKHREDSVIRLRLEPMEDGKATRIHASVDVPAVAIMMGQPNMVLSEAKVEDELRKLLEGLGRKLANATDTDASRGLSDLLTAVAIASNDRLQAQANDIRRDPQGFAERIALSEDLEDVPAIERPADGDWGEDAAAAAPDKAGEEEALSDDWGVN